MPSMISFKDETNELKYVEHFKITSLNCSANYTGEYPFWESIESAFYVAHGRRTAFSHWQVRTRFYLSVRAKETPAER